MHRLQLRWPDTESFCIVVGFVHAVDRLHYALGPFGSLCHTLYVARSLGAANIGIHFRLLTRLSVVAGKGLSCDQLVKRSCTATS